MTVPFNVSYGKVSDYYSISRRLRAYESHMSTVALSNVESARTVSQILYEMANASDF